MRASLVSGSLLAFTVCLLHGHTVEQPLQISMLRPSSHTRTPEVAGARGAPEGARPAAMPSGGGLRFFPGRVISAPIGVTARKIILEAYQLTQYQLSQGPGWLDSERFSLEATAEGATARLSSDRCSGRYWLHDLSLCCTTKRGTCRSTH